MFEAHATAREIGLAYILWYKTAMVAAEGGDDNFSAF